MQLVGNARATSRRGAAGPYGMVRVRLDQHSLTATAAVAWRVDLPRHPQQVLFDTEFADPPRWRSWTPAMICENP